MSQPSAHDSLVAALMKLGAAQPIETVRVNEACEAAGISRATFYRIATSPADFLADELRKLHHKRRGDYAKLMAMPGVDQAPLYYARISLIMGDILERADVYRQSFSHKPSVLADELIEYFRVGIEDFMSYRAEEFDVPDSLRNLPVDVRVKMMSSHFSNSMFGAISGWLESDGRIKVEEAVKIYFDLAPQWYRRSIGVEV